MKRKFNFKMTILTGVFVLGTIVLGTTKSQAVLQANPTTHKSPANKVGSAWITEIRKMETSGQTMGLNETLNGLEATSESNHIDVHMVLPTEYGATAILSASGYGNPGRLQDESDTQKRTTTGNSTGVYFTGNRYEWLASSRCLGESKYNKLNIECVGSILASNSTQTWHGASGIVGIDGQTLQAGRYNSYIAGGVRIV